VKPLALWCVPALALVACGGGQGALVPSFGDGGTDADAGSGATDLAAAEAAGMEVGSAEAGADAGLEAIDAPSEAAPLPPTFCERGVDVADVIPYAGFCLKRFAAVTEARALVWAPNGDLFVAAPARATPGGASGGPGAIIVLSDDDHDGVAEQHVFLSKIDAGRTLDDVHGLALGGGFLYFTTQASVWRVPWAAGQRAATAPPEDLGLPPTFSTGGRWTHGLARSKGGQLLASRGSYAQCGTNQGGEISSIGPGGALTTVAAGFRNPMYMRCHATDELCAATELGEDLAAGAREKLVFLRPGTNYGYPCCYTRGTAAVDGMSAACSDVAAEEASFPLSDTPFGFDWEPGLWPAPFSHALFVALHGSAYSSPSWQGAALVYAPTDPTTHAPTQDWQPFLGGFGFGGTVLDRPADVVFSGDGRLFFADDNAGFVYWLAPIGLMAP
jgi:glucose/arabinose dehydrogenase